MTLRELYRFILDYSANGIIEWWGLFDRNGKEQNNPF